MSPAAEITHFVLDTDIGTDVDDILAIAVILGSPELQLDAVTTVYGDVALRARMVARTLRIASHPIRPIIPGRAETRSGRPVWWPGHEGALMAALDAEPFEETGDAIGTLANARSVAAIGPLTNIAESVERGGHQTQAITMMSGEFVDGIIEHNIRCDVTAADVVFRSHVPITVVGLDQTQKVRLRSDVLDEIRSSGEFGELLAAEMVQFWQFTSESSNVPHDPVAILTMTSPELFQFTQGTVSVMASGPREGLTTFEPGANGPHRIVTNLDASPVAEAIVSRILRATRAPVTPQPTQ